MFPQIIGLLAFDTPFLGISPGVIAHGAEGHYKTASSAYSAFSELSSAFGWGGAAGGAAAATSKSGSPGSNSPKTTPPKFSQPAGLIANGSSAGDAAASPRWQSWGKYAMFAGAAGVAAGGAAALYSQREKLSSGWGWVSGHLEFVGCLLRGEELRGRVERVGGLGGKGQDPSQKGGGGECGNGFKGSAIFYTLLGRGANSEDPASKTLLDGSVGGKRTFCKLPQNLEKKADKQQLQKSLQNGTTGAEGLVWIPTLNDKAADEISAHTSMFYPRDNPGFYGLGERGKESVVSWVLGGGGGWYEGSEEAGKAPKAGRGRGTWSGGKAGTGTGMGMGSGGTSHEREHVWVRSHDAVDSMDEDVRMRDGSVDAEDLEGSVLVDKANVK